MCVCVQDCPSQAFYAVFDGHIGVEAAAYASVHLLTNVVRHPAFLSDPETAIKEGFKTTDERFCEKVCLFAWLSESKGLILILYYL